MYASQAIFSCNVECLDIFLGILVPPDRNPQDYVQINRSDPGDDGPGTLCLSVFFVHLPSTYRTSVA